MDSDLVAFVERIVDSDLVEITERVADMQRYRQAVVGEDLAVAVGMELVTLTLELPEVRLVEQGIRAMPWWRRRRLAWRSRL